MVKKFLLFLVMLASLFLPFFADAADCIVETNGGGTESMVNMLKECQEK